MKELLVADTTISHYRILSLIGVGGMGEVYLAHDTKLDRTVALKILPADLTGDRKRMQRFVQEAKLASALNHPNICVIHEVNKTDEGRPFIVMEYIEGSLLDAVIAGRSLDTAEILDVGIQVADALDEAHSKAIIHRDIKPANIIITARGQAKVLDFGLAKLTKPVVLTSDVPTMPDTDPGAVVGTVQYMSPEQALGQEADHRSDIFSLGVVLYEMATGRRPFCGAIASEVIHQITHAEPEAMGRFNGNAPAELERITRKCLEKDRERRYQSARELMVDLKNLKRDIDSGARIIEKAVPKNELGLNEDLTSTLQQPVSKRLFSARLVIIFVAAIMLAMSTWLLFRPRGQDKSDSLSSMKFEEVHSWRCEPGDFESGAKFSPDGNLIAFSLLKGGWQSIWIKQIFGGEPFRITNDECIDWNPVWSPDGQQIAFASDRGGQRGIWSIPAFGGTPTLLKTLGPIWAVPKCWSKDRKTIYYELRSNLFALDLVSKTTAQITDFDSSKLPYKSFSISPDEDRITYADAENGQLDIWVMPMKGGKPIQVTNDPAQDLYPVWHPDGRRIIYQSKRAGTKQICVAYLDGREPVQITVGGVDHYVSDVSTDGKRVLDITSRDESDIFYAEIDTGKEFEVTSEIGLKLWPEVSPNGRMIVFQSANEQGKLLHSSILAKPITIGSQQIEIAADGFSPSWSPDNDKLAFLRVSDNKINLFTVKIIGGEEKQLTTDGIQIGGYSSLPCNRVHTRDYSWSPDGAKILYCSNKSGQPNIRMVNADGSEETNISTNTDTNLSFNCPLWSPDGKRIAYLSEAKKPLADGKKNWSIWLAEQGSSETIFQADSFLRLIGWSESGNEIMVGIAEGNSDYVAAPKNGTLLSITASGKRAVAHLKSAYFLNIQLSPDKRTIAFVSDQDGMDNIWVIPAGGGEARKITGNADRRVYFSSLAWSPDGKAIYYSKQTRRGLISMIDNFR